MTDEKEIKEIIKDIEKDIISIENKIEDNKRILRARKIELREFKSCLIK